MVHPTESAVAGNLRLPLLTLTRGVLHVRENVYREYVHGVTLMGWDYDCVWGIHARATLMGRDYDCMWGIHTRASLMGWVYTCV